MIAEILAGIAVITVLIMLLLLAVMKERLTRSLGVLRHIRDRYTEPLEAFSTQWERIVAFNEERENRSPASPGLHSADDQGYTARNDM